MTTYSFIAADGDIPTATEVARRKSDSQYALKQKGQTRRNIIKGLLASILNRMTLANSAVSVLLAIGALLVAQTFA